MRLIAPVFLIVMASGYVTNARVEDSATCGPQKEVMLTVTQKDSKNVYLFLVKGKEIEVQLPPLILMAKNSQGEEKIEEEYTFNVDKGTSIKTQYVFQNWRHCGDEDEDDVRVRIYSAWPTRRVFLKELSCKCKNS